MSRAGMNEILKLKLDLLLGSLSVLSPTTKLSVLK